MRVKHALPLAVLLVLGMGTGGAVIAQGGAQPATPSAAPALSAQQIRLLEREGSIAANLGGAYESAVAAHAAALRGRDQIALNQVYDARTQLMGVQKLKVGDPELDRAVNDLLTLTTLAQRRLSARSPVANQALQELVLRFSQTMAALPQLGGGGGGGAPAILTQKLAPELLTDAYRALAHAEIALAQGDARSAALWLDEAQNQVQMAQKAPGNERVQDLIGAVSPAIQVAQMQTAQKSPEALASTGKALSQMATRLGSTR